MLSILTLALLLPISSAVGGTVLTGDRLQISYNPTGTWNDAEYGVYYYSSTAGAWVDFTWPGTPYNAWHMEWTQDGTERSQFAESGYTTTTATAVTESVESTATDARIVHTYTTDTLLVTKTETWELGASTVLVEFGLTNVGATEVTDFRLLFEFDPDQDAAVYGYGTQNDAADLDEDTFAEWVGASGPSSGLTIGIGACDPVNSEVGSYADWGGSFGDADLALLDADAAIGDAALGLRWTAPRSIPAGGSMFTTFVVPVAEDLASAQADWATNSVRCASCDTDADGYESPRCGGDDCADDASAIHPGAAESWYDGVDADCDGLSDFDMDADGYDAAEYGGADCDDGDATAYPGGPDEWYDGVDGDCAGNDDYDQDGDGHATPAGGGGDCDDENVDMRPDAPDAWYDGVDADCAGNDDFDQDGDGEPAESGGGTDCDDTDATKVLEADCAADTGSGDTDDPDDTDGGGSCGCAADPAAGASMVAALVAAGALVRRRRAT